MMHKRTEIRNLIYQALKKQDIKVHNQRYYPIQLDKSPYSLIYTHSEQVDYVSPAFPRSRQRSLRLVIETIATGMSIDDKLDDESERIESVLNTSVGLNIKLLSMSVQTDASGERPIGVMVSEWEIIYLDRESKGE